MSFDQAMAKFEKFIKSDEVKKLVSPTESDTRSKVIDFILKNVLGWPENAISREGHVHHGYYDYKLTSIHMKIVIEAKKMGEYFSIPIGKKDRIYKLKNLMKTSGKIKSAIEQVRGYCDDLGTEFAGITNGSEWIFFRAVTPRQGWRDGDALCFKSLDDILLNFNLFYSILSFNNIDEYGLRDQLSHSSISSINYQRALDEIPYSNNSLERNPLAIRLNTFIDAMFRDLTNDEQIEILRQCYIDDRSVDSIEMGIEYEINGTLPGFAKRSGFSPIAETDNESGRVQTDLYDALKGNPVSSTILLLGKIGCGKTTFLHKLFKINMPSTAENKILWFYVPFTDAPGLESQLESYLYSTIWDQFQKNNIDPTNYALIEACYKDEIKSLENGLWTLLSEERRNDEKYNYIKEKIGKPEFIQKILKHYALDGFRPIIVIDNVDQREPEEQNIIFFSARNLAAKSLIMVIVALREESFFNAQQIGTFNAYHNERYHLSSPRVGTLLHKRVALALNAFTAPAINYKKHEINRIVKDGQDIKEFLSIVSENVLTKNILVPKCIEAISQGNMRDALDMFNTFITSGATNTYKLKELRDYKFAEHEFIKSVMLGDRQFYKDSKSVISNLFEVSNHIKSSNLTALYILNYLKTKYGAHHPEGPGFLDIDSCIASIDDIFNIRDDINFQMTRLLEKKLIELDNRQTEKIDKARFVRISTRGNYYIKILSGRFQYLDIISLDTPINNPRVVSELKSLHNYIDIFQRIRRVELLIAYLITEDIRLRDIANKTLLKQYFPIALSIETLYAYQRDLNKFAHKHSISKAMIIGQRAQVWDSIGLDIGSTLQELNIPITYIDMLTNS